MDYTSLPFTLELGQTLVLSKVKQEASLLSYDKMSGDGVSNPYLVNPQIMEQVYQEERNLIAQPEYIINFTMHKTLPEV